MSNMNPNQRRNVELHIEELVLDGFPSQDRNHIASVVQQELHRLLSQGELPQGMMRNNNIARLDGGTISVEPQATTESTGASIARNLYGGLQQ